MKKIVNLLYFFSFISLPLYVFPSGSLQISHILLILSSTAYLVLVKFKFKFISAFLIFYFLFVFFRELSVFFVVKNIDGLLNIMYLMFNIIVFIIIKKLFCQTWFSNKFFKNAVILAAIVAIVGIFIFGFKINIDSDGGRAVGTFNNPNQLGYFSVCIISISSLLFFRKKISGLEFFILANLCLFMAVVSLSKAAMLSIAIPLILIIFALIHRYQSGYNKKFSIIIFILLFFVLIASLISNSSVLEQYAFYNRLVNIGYDKDDSLTARGYNILFEANNFELFFGYGVARTKELIGYEVHSTFGSVIINYGIIGFIFFMGFIIKWVKKIFINYGLLGLCMVVFPSMMYGLTHNGIRFTIFWILLALSFSNNSAEVNFD